MLRASNVALSKKTRPWSVTEVSFHRDVIVKWAQRLNSGFSSTDGWAWACHAVHLIDMELSWMSTYAMGARLSSQWYRISQALKALHPLDTAAPTKRSKQSKGIQCGTMSRVQQPNKVERSRMVYFRPRAAFADLLRHDSLNEKFVDSFSVSDLLKAKVIWLRYSVRGWMIGTGIKPRMKLFTKLTTLVCKTDSIVLSVCSSRSNLLISETAQTRTKVCSLLYKGSSVKENTKPAVKLEIFSNYFTSKILCSFFWTDS